MANVSTAAAEPQRLQLLRVLGPAHVWALGVGIVLVGEYMGWNFSIGKGGMIAGLIACCSQRAAIVGEIEGRERRPRAPYRNRSG